MIEKMHSMTVLIPGMTTNSSAAKLEQVLNETPGVVSAIPDLAHKKVTLNFNAGVFDAFDIVDAVRDAGLDVLTEELTMPILGMTCISCVAHVEGALSDIPGVVTVTADLSKETATVTMITDSVKITELQTALSRSGYRALIETTDSHLELDERIQK